MIDHGAKLFWMPGTCVNFSQSVVAPSAGQALGGLVTRLDCAMLLIRVIAPPRTQDPCCHSASISFSLRSTTAAKPGQCPSFSIMGEPGFLLHPDARFKEFLINLQAACSVSLCSPHCAGASGPAVHRDTCHYIKHFGVLPISSRDSITDTPGRRRCQ